MTSVPSGSDKGGITGYLIQYYNFTGWVKLALLFGYTNRLARDSRCLVRIFTG